MTGSTRTVEVVMDVPETLRYTEDHEWLRLDGDEATVGITAYATEELGDIVFVELPAVGRRLAQGEPFGVIESVKTASDLYAPMGGEVLAVNEALAGQPELVNAEPYGAGWMLRLRADDLTAATQLMDAAAYRDRIGS
jgi:glycine cleavage system H protein